MAQEISTTATVELLGEETLEQTQPQGPPPFFPEPPDGPDDGDRFGDGDGSSGSPLGNGRLGLLIFLGAETMFFAGLIGSFLVFRVAHTVWPPAAMPRLPIMVTGINTLILLYSAYTMWRAKRAIRGGQQRLLVQMLSATAGLGLIFLGVQGFEWVRLIGYGLTLSSGVYGATFYVLVGCHGLHVLGAVIWLISVLLGASRGRYTASNFLGVTLCGMYWYYVVALWPVLYGLVYLY
jgi:heme/copper-type cytochrome/quinol oxidase subunit 3